MSSAERVDHLLNRIGELNPALRAVICTAPDAMSTAIERDVELRAGHRRSALHGVAVLVKDNIDTADLPTTAGSLALSYDRPSADAGVVQRLREAGAVVLGKTNLSEWANIRSPHSTSGWSGVGGLTANPWGPGRNAGGSSSGSGSAVAAGLCEGAIGTETDGSIVCPSALNGIVGLKPTVGLLTTDGIVPISHSQDAPGPMARSVAMTATLLDVLADSRGQYAAAADIALASDALSGMRIGVARAYFGEHPGTDAVAEEALRQLSAAGCVIVDPADVPTLPSYDAGDDELTVLLHELKRDLDAYLTTRPMAAVRTLDDVVAFNREHAAEELPWFGQEFFEMALTEPMRDTERYTQARQRNLVAARDGLDAVFAEHSLDALVAPTYGPAWLSDLVNGDQVKGGAITSAPAIAGYPILTVPMGFVHGLPVGLGLVGKADSEATLLRIARGVELSAGLLVSGALHPPGW